MPESVDAHEAVLIAHDRIGAVVLAAGAASRMGRSKLTLPYGDSTVIGTVLTRLFATSVEDVVVVTGYHGDEVEAAIGGAVRTTTNPDPDRGNLSSLRCGLDALGDGVDGVLILLGDMPEVDPGDIDALVERFASGSVDAAVCVYTDGWGHPAVVSRELIDGIDTDTDKPLWLAIRALPEDKRIEVSFDKPKPLDINTPQDHESATSDRE